MNELYRRCRNLAFVSKVIGEAVASQLVDYQMDAEMDDNDLGEFYILC